MKTKKIYMQPTSRAITVDESEIIAQSPGGGQGNQNPAWDAQQVSLKFDLFNLDNDGQSNGNIEEEGFAD